jgi:hypothetical protein
MVVIFGLAIDEFVPDDPWEGSLDGVAPLPPPPTLMV